MKKRALALLILFSFLSKPCLGVDVYPFRGSMNFPKKELTFYLGPEKQFLSGQLVDLPENQFVLNLKCEHLKALGFEISSELQLAMQFLAGASVEETFLEGTVQSRYSLLNQKPIEEVNGKFTFRDQILYFPSLTSGPFHLSGFFQFAYPNQLELVFEFKNVTLENVSSYLLDQSDFTANGVVSGTIQISGVPDRLFIRGNISGYDGVLGKLKYNNIVINLEGQYPMLNVTNSMITETDGLSFNIEGQIDATDKKSLTNSLHALKKSALVSKDSSSSEWTIKKMSDDRNKATELKYFLRKKDSKTNPFKEESDILGVEQKIKF